jgi:UDP-N-acetylmuramoyl-tripeptide--D-alanyl-D-alanine ligase
MEGDFYFYKKNKGMNIEALYALYKKNPIVFTDTRKAKKNGIFFALKGPNFNGNEYAYTALQQGAAYAVIDDNTYATDERYIVTNNVLDTLQQLAYHHRNQMRIPVIAITGSNGKTTTKELITHVLRTQYRTHATEGNLNNHIGVPLTLLSMPADTEIAVIEMGANHQKEIEAYCKIAAPTHGVITNCGKAHIEGFGGEEGVRKGKGELYDFLSLTNGVIFRNADLKYLDEMAGKTTKQITYGSKQGATYTGKAGMNGVFLTIEFDTDYGTQYIETNLAGEYNFPNVMTAIAVGLYFGIEPKHIATAIEQYKPDNSRSQWLKKGTNNLILDAYNANPTSMAAAIRNFENLTLTNKCLWLGGMKEMGNDEEKEHQELLNIVAEYQWHQVILVGREFKSLKHEYIWFHDSSAAAEYVKNNHPDNCNILVKGSRGSKMEELVAALSS